MPLSAQDFVRAAFVGAAATLVMDLWNLFLRRAFGIRSLDYALLGRWLLHMPAGRFVHASIAAAAPKRLERAVGYAVHYSIGVGLATGGVALAALAGIDWLARPTLPPALAYGIATVVFPFFLLQPALGLGAASSKSPHPAAARLKSLGTHTVFGVGLYLAALVVNELGRLVG